MRVLKLLLHILIIGITGIITNCGINGLVTDFSGKSTYVNSMYLLYPEKLEVYEGFAFRKIGLDEIKTLKVVPDVYKILNRNLFCLAEIVLDNGTVLGTLEKGSEKSNAYISVNNYLMGNADDCDYKILIHNVLVIQIAE